MSAGDFHSLVLAPNGSVWAFGSNGRGQLGDGTTRHRARPVAPRGLSGGVVKVSAGGYHSLALTWEGDVLAWGENTTGQLGRPTNGWQDEVAAAEEEYADGVTRPVFPAGLRGSDGRGVRDVAAGFLHSLALLADGRLLAWGCNIFGQLGPPPRPRPRPRLRRGRSPPGRRCGQELLLL